MMTDVATVSSQVTVQHGVGAKGAAASTGAGTVLDGAFAALLGAAGQVSADGDAATDGKTAQAVIDPALIGGDASVAVAGNGLATETGETQLLTGDTDPATGKPRKGATRGKSEAKGDDALLQMQAVLVGGVPAPAQNVAGEHPAASAKAGTDGVALDAASTKSNTAAALAVTAQTSGNVQAVVSKDSMSEKPAKDIPKGLPTPESTAPARESTVVQIASDASRQPADQSAEGDGRDAREKPAGQAIAADDDSALAGGADPLRDIVQSLPPVIQSQLGAASAAGAGRAVSAGEALSNHAIDMSVSGQWIDHMAREIATVADGSGHARFQLNPPSLGRIQVDVWRGDDQMNLRLLAETDEAARRLREGQAGLEAHARVASLSLGSVSVEKSSAPLESGDKQNQRQGAEQNGTTNQQSFAQAQGQSAQGRNNNSGGNLNRTGASAVIGSERQAELERNAPTTRAGEPRVRFA